MKKNTCGLSFTADLRDTDKLDKILSMEHSFDQH